MAKARPKLKIVEARPWKEQLPKADAALTTEMIDIWTQHCLGRNYEEKSVKRDVAAVVDFIFFSGRPPWAWSEEDFDRWNVHLLRDPKRGVRPSTLRTYQGAIRRFLDYLVANQYFQAEVRRQFRTSILQICTEKNCLPHQFENEAVRPHRAFTHKEFRLMNNELNRQIIEALQFGSKNLHPLQRDKALYYLLYVGALRVSEGLGTNTNNYFENPEFPQFGKYGRVEIWGKGHQGSGARRAVVVIDHPKLPEVLKWYEEKVRPHFLKKDHADETAMFLSERGRRLDITTVDVRFKKLVLSAGLDATELTPHSLRRSSATHGGMEMNSTIPQQHKLRHANLGTTESYADYPDPWVRSTHNKAIRRRIDKAKAATTSKSSDPKMPNT